MPYLGGVFLNTVYAETPQKGVKVTEHPIEEHVNIVDHIEKKAITMDISGVIVGPDSSVRRTRLEQFMNAGTPLTYSYRNKLTKVIIEEFDATHDVEIKSGFKFSIKLRQIRISKSSYLVNLKLPVKIRVKPVGNKGIQQKKAKKGRKKQ